MRLLLILFCLSAQAQTPSSLEPQISPSSSTPLPDLKKLISKHCADCHSRGARQAQKFGDFLQDSVLKKYLDGIEAERSELYQKVESGDMPKIEDGYFLGDAERLEFLAAIKAWVNNNNQSSGEKPVAINRVDRSNEDVFVKIERYLDSQTNRNDIRFLALDSSLPGGRDVAAQNPQLIEYGIRKLMNSLSWAPRLAMPQRVEGTSLVAIRLSEFGWDWYKWNALASVYPYKRLMAGNAGYQKLAAITQTDAPVIRGDWFLFHASRNQLYNYLLGLPTNLEDLEKILGINIERNYTSGSALRSGFRVSGVSANNRIIERHEIRSGAFWLSYDFSKSTLEGNIFKRPLGPKLSSGQRGDIDAFAHDGSEAIFNLPNGLQAYFLVNRNGNQLLEGPTEIVQDPDDIYKVVRPGVSCMRCHNEGIIRKQDEIFSDWQKRPFVDSKSILHDIQSLYQSEKINAAMEKDRQRFSGALNSLGIPRNIKDPAGEVSKALQKSDNDFFPDHIHFMSVARFGDVFIRSDGRLMREAYGRKEISVGESVVVAGSRNERPEQRQYFAAEVASIEEKNEGRRNFVNLHTVNARRETLATESNILRFVESFDGISIGDKVYVREGNDFVESIIREIHVNYDRSQVAFTYGENSRDLKFVARELVFLPRPLWIYNPGEKIDFVASGSSEQGTLLAMRGVNAIERAEAGCRVEAVVKFGFRDRKLRCLLKENRRR